MKVTHTHTHTHTEARTHAYNQSPIKTQPSHLVRNIIHTHTYTHKLASQYLKYLSPKNSIIFLSPSFFAHINRYCITSLCKFWIKKCEKSPSFCIDQGSEPPHARLVITVQHISQPAINPVTLTVSVFVLPPCAHHTSINSNSVT